MVERSRHTNPASSDGRANRRDKVRKFAGAKGLRHVGEIGSLS